MSKPTIIQEWYQLTGIDFRLYEQLSYYERCFGKVFPSQKTLAFRLKCSIRTVRRSIAHLKKLGLLHIQPRKYQNRAGQWRSRSNVYKLCGFLGAKVRSLFNRFTGRPQVTSRTKTIEKKELFEFSNFSNIKNDEVKNILKRWMERKEGEQYDRRSPVPSSEVK